jgi:hypothetical protein
MDLEYKTEDDKKTLLKTIIGAVVNGISWDVHEEPSAENYWNFKNNINNAHHASSTDVKRDFARKAMNYWYLIPWTVNVFTEKIIYYVTLLKNILDLLDDDSKKNDVWIRKHKDPELQTRAREAEEIITTKPRPKKKKIAVVKPAEPASRIPDNLRKLRELLDEIYSEAAQQTRNEAPPTRDL